MKRIFFFLLFFLIAIILGLLIGNAQELMSPVELNELNKLQIENEVLKLNNISLSIQLIQSRQEKIQQDLLIKVNEIKTSLKLDDSYEFDYSTLVFKLKIKSKGVK